MTVTVSASTVMVVVPNRKVRGEVLSSWIASSNASLLSSGVVEVMGSFSPGDVVDIVTEDGALIGRGVSEHISSEILGQRPKEDGRVRDRSTVIIRADQWVPLEFDS